MSLRMMQAWSLLIVVVGFFAHQLMLPYTESALRSIEYWAMDHKQSWLMYILHYLFAGPELLDGIILFVLEITVIFLAFYIPYKIIRFLITPQDSNEEETVKE